MEHTAQSSEEAWGEESLGEVSWGEESLGEVSWGEETWGEEKWGEESLGEVSWVEETWGEEKWGEESLGEEAWGEESLGEVSLGEESLGEESLGEVSWGEETWGEEKWGEESLGEVSWGEESLGEEAWGEESLGEELAGHWHAGRQLGIGMQGEPSLQHLINIHFYSKDLSKLAAQRPAMLYFVFNTKLVPYFPPLQSAKDFPPHVCVALMREAAGVPDLDVRLDQVAPWTMSAQVADRFHDADTSVEVFLVVDANTSVDGGGGGG
eukprot:gene22736-29901_t